MNGFLNSKNKQKSLFTACSTPKKPLNISADPFVPTSARSFNSSMNNQERGDMLNESASSSSASSQSNTSLTYKISFDSKIWKSISARGPRNSENSVQRPLTTRPSIPNTFLPEDSSFQAEILINGIMHIYMKDIHIELTLDRAIRLSIPKYNVSLSVSSSANSLVLFHPNGRIHQSNSRVDVIAHNGLKQNNFVFAKVWYKGISFTSKNCPLTYLLDAAGLRTTVDKYPEITSDALQEIFLNDSRHGQPLFGEAQLILEKSVYSRNYDGTETIIINQMRLTKSADGNLTIQRPNNKCLIRFSLNTGSIAVTTLMLHVTASCADDSSHLFVKRGDRRIHYDGSIFSVRNAGHSAGFDENNSIKIFT